MTSYTSYTNELTNKYGNFLSTNIKEYMKINSKLAKLENRKIFLLKCKCKDLFPKFLKLNLNHLQINHKINKLNHILENFQKQILNLTIEETFAEINIQKKKYNTVTNIIKHHLNQNELKNFIQTQKLKQSRVYENIKEKNIKKLLNLTKEKHRRERTELMKHYNENFFQNLSSKIIPENTKIIFSLGPNFGLKYEKKKLPIINTISSIEAGIQNSEQAEDIRINISQEITKFLYKYKSKEKKFQNSLLKIYIDETKEFLQSNPDIIITNADKSNQTIIMDKIEYENKIKDLLNDTNTYKIITHDPINRIQTKLNKIITKLHNNKVIDFKMAKFLKSYNSIAPAFYGLPKTHKLNVPLRPICSCIQSAFYNSSTFLEKPITKILGKTTNHIKDSWDFAKFIANKKIPDNYIIISLDVKSLYTNVNLNLVLEAINKRWLEISEHTKLSKSEFLELLNFLFSEFYLRYNDTYYAQISGLPMGLPLSAPLANLVMEDLEDNVIQKLQFQVPFYKRYIDDIIMAIPNNKINETLNLFNSYNPNLQFTVEIEINNTISFLDILLKRDSNNIIKIEWFRKISSSNRFLNFHGNNPITHKRNVVTAIVDRAIHFTDPEFRPNILNKVKTILKENNYPCKFYSSIIKDRVSKFYNNNVSLKDDSKFISIPYIPDLSENINKILRKYKFKAAYKINNNIKQSIFSKLKFKVEKQKKINTIYKIDCADCNSCYIGTSEQYLDKRITQHKSNVRLKKKDSTALCDHAINANHNFNFNLDDIKILNTVQPYKKRLITEMCYIQNHKNSINKRSDIENLSKFYKNILTKI